MDIIASSQADFHFSFFPDYRNQAIFSTPSRAALRKNSEHERDVIGERQHIFSGGRASYTRHRAQLIW